MSHCDGSLAGVEGMPQRRLMLFTIAGFMGIGNMSSYTVLRACWRTDSAAGAR